MKQKERENESKKGSNIMRERWEGGGRERPRDDKRGTERERREWG